MALAIKKPGYGLEGRKAITAEESLAWKRQFLHEGPIMGRVIVDTFEGIFQDALVTINPILARSLDEAGELVSKVIEDDSYEQPSMDRVDKYMHRMAAHVPNLIVDIEATNGLSRARSCVYEYLPASRADIKAYSLELIQVTDSNRFYSTEGNSAYCTTETMFNRVQIEKVPAAWSYLVCQLAEGAQAEDVVNLFACKL